MQYLRQRKSGAYFYQRRVPKELQHRKDLFKHQFIEEYLATTDRAVAKRQVSTVNEKWERTFDALRRDEKVTSEQLSKIRQIVQFEAHLAMLSDPQDGPELIKDRQGDFGPEFDARVAEALERVGLPHSKRNLELAMQAVWEGSQGALILFDQGLTPPEPKFSIAARETAVGGHKLNDALEHWSQERKPAARTIKEWRRTLSRFKELHGDIAIAAITRTHVAEFKDALAACTKHLSHKERAQTLPEIVEASKGRPSLSPTSVNKQLGAIKSLLSHAVGQGWIETNVAIGVRMAGGRGEERPGFEPGEVLALLEATAGFKKSHPTRYWLPRLAAYTGARMEELGQLQKVHVCNEGGIDYIDISNSDGRSVKTRSSRRRVPLHPELVRMGFLTYAADQDDLLFPDLKPDTAGSRTGLFSK